MEFEHDEHVVRTTTGDRVATIEYEFEELAPAFVVLPEALALLKRYWDTEDIPYGILEDVLKRAGVLP